MADRANPGFGNPGLKDATLSGLGNCLGRVLWGNTDPGHNEPDREHLHPDPSCIDLLRRPDVNRPAANMPNAVIIIIKKLGASPQKAYQVR